MAERASIGVDWKKVMDQPLLSDEAVEKLRGLEDDERYYRARYRSASTGTHDAPGAFDVRPQFHPMIDAEIVEIWRDRIRGKQALSHEMIASLNRRDQVALEEAMRLEGGWTYSETSYQFVHHAPVPKQPHEPNDQGVIDYLAERARTLT